MNIRTIANALHTRASRRAGMLGLLAFTTAFFMTPATHGQSASAGAAARAEAGYGKIPLSFERNAGQAGAEARFVARGSGYAIALYSDGASLGVQSKSGRAAVRMRLAGANLAAAATAEQPLPGTVNYFRGNNSAKWVKDVPTFARVRYQGVYPGVDLVYYGNQRELEYDFVVAPGTNPARIGLDFEGAEPAIAADGSLKLKTQAGDVIFQKPIVYQNREGARSPVGGGYVVRGSRVRFAIAAYDRRRPLVIDPVLSYATYLGGSQMDTPSGIAVDSSGSAYVAGTTASTDFPVKGGYEDSNGAGSNGFAVFVSKLNPAGTALIYSTYIYGAYDSLGDGIAVDSSGNAYVAGYTSAPDYPVTAGAFQTVCGGNHDSQGNRVNGCGPSADTSGFITKLNAKGDGLVYSTFLSGAYYNQITAIAVDSAGEAYVTGNSNAGCGTPPYNPGQLYACFPTTTGAYQAGTATPAENFGFLTRLNAAGTALVYSTAFASVAGSSPGGGQVFVTPYAIAADNAGAAYITGRSGYGLPTTAGAYYVPPADTSNVDPPFPAFVAKFDTTRTAGNGLIYSTFLGSAAQTADETNYSSYGQGITVDAAGDAIVAGYTNACGYPTTPGAYQTANDDTDGTNCYSGFITKLNLAGTGLIWSTLLGDQPGSSNNVELNAITLGPTGNVYVTGVANTGNFPTVEPVHAVLNGGAVIAELDPTASKLLFSTYISGDQTDTGLAIAVDPSGNIYGAGKTYGTTLPVTRNAPQSTYGGGAYDAYAVKINPFDASATTLTLSPNPATEGANIVLTARVAKKSGAGVPSGSVTFLYGSIVLGTVSLNASGVAVAEGSSAGFPAGSYALTAKYSGDATDAVSTSAAATLVLKNATTTTLSASPTSVAPGGKVTATATVKRSGASGVPTGTVTFYVQSAEIGAASVNGSGVATLSEATTGVAAGSYPVYAVYAGDSADGSSSSGTVTVTVQ